MNNYIEHHCNNGCIFTSETLNLSSGVLVDNRYKCDPLKMATDFAEFGAWFAINVHPRLQSFPGFDAISFKMKS